MNPIPKFSQTFCAIALTLAVFALPFLAFARAHPAKPTKPVSAQARLNERLGQAVLHSDAAKVEMLLRQGASPKAQVTTPGFFVAASALLVAEKSGQTRIVQMLLDKGADISGKNDIMPPLLVAVHLHHTDMVKMLLDKGANPSAPGLGGLTPLMDAAGNGDTEIVRMLLAKKANVAAHDEEGLTALKMATNNDHADIVALLKAAGAKK